ncbi:MAG TPA: MMPL family transporter [Nocardioides sp.]|jgi:putative drug exporter of the RND superfamily|uniref:MMPL family transporter n=1 Tax=Nocardioides sp. TaxID=35761 RepID=UPI002C6D73F3|nr:MMPL family transporter [Nocardioides sp.]HTW16690.1 MMPL family transporter [Nocardioides sp.]
MPAADQPDPGRLHALTRLIVSRRTAWLFALVPLLLGGVLLGLVGEVERETQSQDNLPDDSQTSLAAQLLQDLPEKEGSTAIVAVTSDEALDQQELDRLAPELVELGAIAPNGASPLTVSEDGTAAVAVVPIPDRTVTDPDEVVYDLRDALDELTPAGTEIQVTGPAAVSADISKVFEGADMRLLLVTMLVVSILLVLTYRSPVLWIIPLLVVGIADRIAAVGSTYLLDWAGLGWDGTTQGILSVLVFGAGTNYALLLISRYRDELRAHADRREAMARALPRTAEAVLASATTVIVGLLTLLLSLTPSTRGLGLACAAGIVVAVVFALVVLPACLVSFDRWIFWPMKPKVGETQLVDAPSMWRRIGTMVSRRPKTVAVSTVVGLGILATGALGINTGLDKTDLFVSEPEAISAADRLSDSFPAGLTNPTTIVTQADPEQVAGAAAEVERVVSARPLSTTEGTSRIEVVFDAQAGSDESEAATKALRSALADFETTYVIGNEAEAIDQAEGAQRDQKLVMPLILGLVSIALLLLLRSVVASLILAVAVVTTYAASMGASWLIFQGIFDFPAVDNTVALFAFLFLVALGVDYSIFLVTRAWEETGIAGPRQGMIRALAATGGVITSAGILLAAVFAALGVLPLVVLAQLGTVICIGVLLDTLVVRTLLVPAMAQILGDRFWWPRRIPENAPAPEPERPVAPERTTSGAV